MVEWGTFNINDIHPDLLKMSSEAEAEAEAEAETEAEAEA